MQCIGPVFFLHIFVKFVLCAMCMWFFLYHICSIYHVHCVNTKHTHLKWKLCAFCYEMDALLHLSMQLASIYKTNDYSIIKSQLFQKKWCKNKSSSCDDHGGGGNNYFMCNIIINWWFAIPLWLFVFLLLLALQNYYFLLWTI